QSRRHHLLQVFQAPCPRKCFPHNQLVQVLRLVLHGAVLGKVESFLCLRLSPLAIRDHRLLLRDRAPLAPRIVPAGTAAPYQYPRPHADRAHGRAPAPPELPRILVRLTSETDINSPLISHVGTAASAVL